MRRGVFSLALKDDRAEQCQQEGSKARESQKAMTLAFVLLDFQHAGVRRA